MSEIFRLPSTSVARLGALVFLAFSAHCGSDGAVAPGGIPRLELRPRRPRPCRAEQRQPADVRRAAHEGLRLRGVRGRRDRVPRARDRSRRARQHRGRADGSSSSRPRASGSRARSTAWWRPRTPRWCCARSSTRTTASASAARAGDGVRARARRGQGAGGERGDRLHWTTTSPVARPAPAGLRP